MRDDATVMRRPQQQPPNTSTESGKRRIGKLLGASSVSGFADVQIYAGATPDAIVATDPAQVVSAYNRWLALASGTWVIIECFPHGWEITQGQC